MKKPWNRNHICTWFSLWPYKLKRLLCERSEDAEIIKQTGHEPMTTLRNGNITYTSKLPNYKENLQSGCYCRLHCTISNAENTIGRIIGFAFIFRFIANQQLSNILQGIKKKISNCRYKSQNHWIFLSKKHNIPCRKPYYWRKHRLCRLQQKLPN